MCDTSAGCYSGLYKFLNFSTQLNSSKREELLRVYWEEVAESKNQSEIPTALLIVTILVFLGMILFGTFRQQFSHLCNIEKTIYAYTWKFIILNLAISDLTLCLITQPFNLLRLLTGNRNWVLGQFMCKFSAMFQGTNIFVSTFSITAIAIDRFQCIIYPTANRGSNNTAVNVNYLTWIIAFFLASPLVYFSRITELNHLQCTEKAENPITQKFKVAYSLAALIIQYMSPLVIVTIVYYRICLSIRDRKLRAMQKICLSQIVRNTTEQPNDKYELVMDTNSKSNQSACLNTNKDCHVTNNGNYDMYAPSNAKCPYYQKRVTSDKQGSAIQPLTTMLASSQKEVIDRRHRKAIILSTVIAIVFCLSWLPMNTLNVISDIRELVIITSIDVALTNLKYHDVEEQVLDNDTVNIESTSSESIFQHSTTSLKAINKIMSIEANNINAITVLITQAVCLLLILSSACINPILYGWLNQSFRAEFYQVLRVHSALMQNMRSSHKNVTPEISSNKNNDTGYRFINNEQADCIQRLPNNHIMNQLSTVDMQNEYYINFSLKNIHGPMKMHEKDLCHLHKTHAQYFLCLHHDQSN
ncbi:unnamed protein product [Heterobilharzia americana]|nr:unnamed protein product [Heterobilharzia americana]